MSKGSPIIIPILAMNRSKAVWGEDAHEFRCVAACSLARNALVDDTPMWPAQSGGKVPSRRRSTCRVCGHT